MARGSYAAKVGWTVGLDRWLDDPASKVNRYWRAMEYGEDFSGTVLIGLWGDRAGNNLRPNLNFLRDGGPLTAAGDAMGQKWVAFGATHNLGQAVKRAKFALWYYVTNGRMGQPTKEELAQVFHRPTDKENRAVFSYMMSSHVTLGHIPFVRAHALGKVSGRHYYKKAVANFRPMQREKQLIKEILVPMFKGSFPNARAAMASDSGGSTKKAGSAKETSDVAGVMQRQQGITHQEGRAAAKGPVMAAGHYHLRAGAAVTDLLRGGGGRFPSGQWQAAVQDVNRAMAKEFQAAVVAEMDKVPHKRPATFDLIKATDNPRNRYPQ